MTNRPLKILQLGMAFLLLVLTLILIGRGKSGSDEASVYAFVEVFRNCGYRWSEFQTRFALLDMPMLSHTLAWFFMQAGFSFVLDKIGVLIPSLRTPLIHGTLMSYLQVAVLFAAVILSYRYLRMKNMPRALVVLILTAIWVGSYGICFFTGGYIENTLCLLIIMRLMVFDFMPNSGLRKPLALSVIDTALFVIKSYSLLYIAVSLLHIALSRNFPRKKNFLWIHGTVFFLLSTLWILLRFSIASAHSNIGFYATLMNNLDVLTQFTFIPITLFKSLLSFSFGLLWTIPVIIIPFIHPHNKTDLFFKSLIIICLLLFFGLFPFWAGGVGIAGNRYIFPFLLILLPNIAESFQSLATRHPRILWAVPLTVILFFPVINYRHTSIMFLVNYDSGASSLMGEDDYTDYPLRFTHSLDDLKSLQPELPHLNPLMHPAIFAWRVQYAKWTHQPSFRPDPKSPKSISTTRIVPMTLAAKIL